MLPTLLEASGFAFVLVFCVLVWWPSAFLVGGLGLILASRAADR